MDPPQLAVRVAGKGSAGVQHGHIVVDKDVSLLPLEAQAHASVVQQAVNQLSDFLRVVLNGDFARRELRLRRSPRLVPAHARRLVHRVPHHQWQVADLGIPKAVVVHPPGRLLQSVDRERVRQVLEEQPRRREQRVTGALLRCCDAREVLEPGIVSGQLTPPLFVHSTYFGGFCTLTSLPCSSFTTLPFSSFCGTNLNMPS